MVVRGPREEGREFWNYVYQLADPRDGSVFYIGRGRRDRILAHEKEASKGLNTRKCQRIRAIWAAGLNIERRIIGLFHPQFAWRSWKAWELELIHERGYENLTNGNCKRFPTVPPGDLVRPPR